MKLLFPAKIKKVLDKNDLTDKEQYSQLLCKGYAVAHMCGMYHESYKNGTANPYQKKCFEWSGWVMGGAQVIRDSTDAMTDLDTIYTELTDDAQNILANMPRIAGQGHDNAELVTMLLLCGFIHDLRMSKRPEKAREYDEVCRRIGMLGDIDGLDKPGISVHEVETRARMMADLMGVLPRNKPDDEDLR